MDNKPLEEEALGFITSRVGKFGYRYAHPNFDEEGGDFLIVEENDFGLGKILKCQSKGRNISEKGSNIRIPSSYVNEWFLLFVYLKTKDLDKDLVYLYLPDEIEQWTLNNKGEYMLYISKDFPDDIKNQKFLFNSQRSHVLQNALDKIVLKHCSEPLEDFELMQILLKLWEKTGSLPDAKLLQCFLQNPDLLYSNELLFLLCAVAIDGKDDIDHSIDWSFQYLKFHCSAIPQISIKETHPITHINSGIAYNRTWIQEVEYLDENKSVEGYHLHIGDNEEWIDGYLFRNGKSFLNYSCK